MTFQLSQGGAKAGEDLPFILKGTGSGEVYDSAKAVRAERCFISRQVLAWCVPEFWGCGLFVGACVFPIGWDGGVFMFFALSGAEMVGWVGYMVY